MGVPPHFFIQVHVNVTDIRFFLTILDWSEDAVDSSEDDRSGDDQYDRKRRTSADGRSGASSDNERLIAAD